MCTIPIATAVITAAASASQYVGQRRQAKQQAAYQRRASIMERQRALQEQTAIRMKQAQQQEAVGREMGELSIKTRQAISRAVTSGGEAGVAGLSVTALMEDFMGTEARRRETMLKQQEFLDVQTGLALSDAGYRSQQNLLGINRPVSRPSPLTAALSAAGNAFGGYRTGLEIEASREKSGRKNPGRNT